MNIADLHLETWGSFFSATAQISGGLVGLVFVALTFRPERLGAAGDVGMRKLADQTFADFLSVLLVSLVMLVPNLERELGRVVAIVGLVGCVRGARSILAVRRAGPGSSPRGPVVQRLALSCGGSLLLVVAGGSLEPVVGGAGSFGNAAFGGVMILMLSGIRSAWLLVMHDAGSGRV